MLTKERPDFRTWTDGRSGSCWELAQSMNATSMAGPDIKADVDLRKKRGQARVCCQGNRTVIRTAQGWTVAT
jgi:hypothetical protein